MLLISSINISTISINVNIERVMPLHLPLILTVIIYVTFVR